MQRALPWLLALLSGVSLALAMPGPGLGPLALLFPIFLLEALERGRGRWTPWLLGWLAGTVYWMITTHWVISVMHHYGGLPQWAAGLCLVGMAAFLGVLWALAAGIASLVSTSSRIWLFPMAWIALGALQRFPPYGFTWTGVASAFVDWSWLTASLPVWGATGLGWCVVQAGASLWGLVQFAARRSAIVALVTSIAAFALTSILAPSPAPTGEPLKVVAIQPGTSLEEKWDPSQSHEIAQKVWAMTADAAVRGADLVLWPESAVPYRLDNDQGYRDAVEQMARQFDVEIVVNSVASLEGGRYTNSVFLVTGEGISTTRYDKVHLVPFGEFVPGWARFAFTESLVREVAAFTPGRRPILLPARVPLAVAICFEVVFPDHIARQVRGGAQLLITLTNDGWYGFSWAPRQHFAQVRVRAAESQRWFVRAALTGISGFIDPAGRVVSKLDVGDAGELAASVQPMIGLTPRVRWGDWWAIVCAAGSIVVLLVTQAGRYAGAKKRSNVQRSALND